VFHRFHQLGDGDGAGKIAQDMDVILDAVDEDRFAADVLQDAGHVSVEPCAEIVILEKWHAVLRAENDMDDNAGEGLRHDPGDCHAPLGRCILFVCDPRAAHVPRLPWAGLLMGLWPTAAQDTRRRGKLLALEVGARITSADQKCFEIPATEDEGLDMELEFTNDDGEGTGRRLYLQLKSGNSYLTKRKIDGAEIFTIKKQRWVEYWLQQPHPVMLVIGTFSEDDERAIGKDKLEFSEVRWMEITSVLQRESANGTKPVKQIVFKGERLDLSSVRRWRERVLASKPS